MYIKLGRVKIHVGFPFAACAAFAANSEAGVRLVIFFTAALLHEAGHACALLCFGAKDMTLELSPGGAEIDSTVFSRLSYREEFAASLMGPVVNIVLFVLLLCFSELLGSKELADAAGANLALGIVNLLPLSFLDGGRALSSAMSMRFSEETVEKACRCGDVLSFVFLSALVAALVACGKNAFFLFVFLVYCVLQKTLRRHLK